MHSPYSRLSDLRLSSRSCLVGVLTLGGQPVDTSDFHEFECWIDWLCWIVEISCPSFKSSTAPCQTPVPPSSSRRQQVRPGFVCDSKTPDLHVLLHCAHLQKTFFCFGSEIWKDVATSEFFFFKKEEKKKATHNVAVYLTAPGVKTSVFGLKCIRRQLLPPASTQCVCQRRFSTALRLSRTGKLGVFYRWREIDTLTHVGGWYCDPGMKGLRVRVCNGTNTGSAERGKKWGGRTMQQNLFWGSPALRRKKKRISWWTWKVVTIV